MEKKKQKKKEAETEQVQPGVKEYEASKDLKEDLKSLKGKEEKSSTPKAGGTSGSTKVSGGVFHYQGKPNLKFVDYDFGIYLTPVTKGSEVYVPIKFITKSYIKKLAPQVSGLEKSAVPKTDKKDPQGRPPGKPWNLDESGTVYYFVDFGQKVKKTNNNNTVEIPLNAYAGQKPGGYEIWLMYEAAVLNKQGFNQSGLNGYYKSNLAGGFDFVGYFKGFEDL